MHSARYAVNCSILFTELPLLERPAAARQAGFGAVEFWCVRTAGYDGWIGLEYKPSSTTAESFDWIAHTD